MAKVPTKRDIGGNTYEFFPLHPMTAMRVLTRVIRMVVEPLGAVGDALKGQGGTAPKGLKALMEADLPANMLSKALGAFAQNLKEDEIADTVNTLLERIHVKTPTDKGTRPIMLEQDFEGKTALMLKVVAASLEINFSDFFGGSDVLSVALAKGTTAMGMKSE